MLLHHFVCIPLGFRVYFSLHHITTYFYTKKRSTFDQYRAHVACSRYIAPNSLFALSFSPIVTQIDVTIYTYTLFFAFFEAEIDFFTLISIFYFISNIEPKQFGSRKNVSTECCTVLVLTCWYSYVTDIDI